MNRRRFLTSASLAALAAAMPLPILAQSGNAAELYRRAIAIDGLGSPGGFVRDGDPSLLPEEVAHLRDSGLTAVHMTIGRVGTMSPLEAFEGAVRDAVRWSAQTDAHPDVLTTIRSVDDLRAAHANDRIGLIFGLQDGVAFEDDLGRLEALRHVGIRVIQPTYNRRNLLGDGVMESSDAGLSRTGIDAIRRMNALGITVDLSHCGRRTAADAIAASSRPVAFTHTGCKALVDHPRHRGDDELRAVADTGGVIGIFVMPYLARGNQPTAADVIAHIEHALDVVGEDHVSIGTDGYVSPQTVTPEFRDWFAEMTRQRKERGIAAPYETEHGYLFASDLNTPRRFETLAERLLERGHAEPTVEKILGANLLRLFEQTWTPETPA